MAPGFDVLVIEDNLALAENVAELLEETGAQVRIASTVDDARAKVRERPFDLAIVDVRLHDEVSGIDLVPFLKESSPDGEVILVTGNATLDTAIAAVRHGVFAYVQKPFQPQDLLALAERALGQVRLRKERSELETRAAEAEAMAAMGRLTAALAHEIRNPLNAAMLQLELMERASKKSGDPAVQKGIGDRVRLVKTDLGRLSTLLDEFLGLARPRHFEKRRVDLVALLADVHALQEPVAAYAGVTIALELAPDVPAIDGDEGRIKQVVLNLVTNALDAMRPQGRGTLTIAASRAPDGAAELRIADTGPGIAPELLRDAFRAFVTSGKPRGTGLGLTIVKKLVELHGGTVTLESTPGTGTTAIVTLPAATT
ncbi:sensor histidine kinase [Sandaracinus amylolyticus]|uniref:sensor histidine kinase n=1 Tax=Sandaracinus amylolyticus TaxID=927083 RepID=UPI001F397D71|nr:ATP-binding protein [Sandaracinus amylolyticus]UJR78868.1 Signal transduction histidine kinase [Sandaracinus amylolyticus]